MLGNISPDCTAAVTLFPSRPHNAQLSTDVLLAPWQAVVLQFSGPVCFPSQVPSDSTAQRR